MTSTTRANTLAAARNRRRRARRKDGLAVFPLLVDEVAITESLIEMGWLSPSDEDDRQKVLEAFSAAHMTVTVGWRYAYLHNSGVLGKVEVANQTDEEPLP